MKMQPYPKTALAFFISQMKLYKKQVIIIYLLCTVAILLERVAPYFFSRIIDVFSKTGMPVDVKQGQAYFYLTLFFVFQGACYIFQYIALRFFLKVDIKLMSSIKSKALSYISSHSTCFLNNNYSGSLGAKITALSKQTIELFYALTFDFYFSIMLLIITFCMLFATNVIFGAIFLIGLITAVAFIVKNVHQLKTLFEKESACNTLISGRIIDIIANHTLVKSYTSIEYEQKMLEPLLANEKTTRKTAYLKMENTKNFHLIFLLFLVVIMMFTSIYLWGQNKISTGDIAFVFILLLNTATTIRFLIFGLLRYQRCIGEMNNALQILSAPHDIVDCEKATDLTIKKASICFKNVQFTYQDNQSVLNNFNLNIKAGEKVGLVGVSGAGKSTIINLLQRFYDVDSGAILIDNHNIATCTQNSLRTHIAVIAQEAHLLNRSIFDNIAYACQNATLDQVITASKQAFAHDFITKLPNGYDSIVGERGVKLSGGQRQRLAVARAILKNAPILILDEATSALDSQSEAYIQNSIKQLMHKKTVIAIAHRLSTLQQMDRIIVLDNGQIIEQGTPAQLLKNNGTYAKLWQIQTQEYTLSKMTKAPQHHA